MEEYYADWGNFTEDEFYSSETSKLSNIEHAIQVFVPPFIITFGTISNLLCMLVFFKFSISKYPSCLFLACLSAFDTVRLYLETGNKWLEAASYHNHIKTLSMKSELHCKVFAYAGHVIMGLDNWLIVVLLLEMLYITRNGRNVVNILQLYVNDVLAILFVTFLLLNVHYFWTFGVIDLHINVDNYGVIREKYCMFHVPLLTGGKSPNQELASIWDITFKIIAEMFPLLLSSILLIAIIKVRFKVNREQHLHLCETAIIEETAKRSKLKKRVELYFLNATTIQQFIFDVYPILGMFYLISVGPHFVFSFMERHISWKITSNPLWTFCMSILLQLKNMYSAFKIIIYVINSNETRYCLAKIISTVMRAFGSAVCSFYSYVITVCRNSDYIEYSYRIERVSV